MTSRSMARLAGIAAAALLAGSAAAQQPADARTAGAGTAWQELVRRFDAYVERDGLVGGAMVLVDGNGIVARHHRGWADAAARTPIDERAIFHYGSITKTLTAIAIMQLRDRGLLDLDDPVTRWVPELRRVHDPFARIDSITVRMLLSHSAGFQNPTWPYRDQPWQPFEPTEWDQLVALMPYQRLHFEPGSRYGYSNPAFIYLARIIEALTGDSWQTYVQKNLFMPLGLERSYFGVTPRHLAADRPHNYDVIEAAGRDSLIDNGTEFDPGITIPNGGWNAPLDDLARYLVFLLGGSGPVRPGQPLGAGAPARPGQPAGPGFEPGSVLARSSLEEMWRPVVRVDDREHMGLSFFLHESAAGTAIIGHTGSQAGYRAYLYFSPRTRRGVIAAFNSAREPTRAAAERQALLAAIDAAIETIDMTTIN